MVAEGEGALSTLILVDTPEAVDLRFAAVVGVIFLAITVFLGGGTGGMEVVEVVDRLDGAGEVLRGLGDGEVSSIDDVVVVRLAFTERFDAAEALRARTGDFDGVVGEVTPSEVLAVLTLVVEALEIAETVLVLVVEWTVELLLPADEGPSDAVLNVEDASLIVETRDCGLDAEFVGLSVGALVLVSVFDGVGVFRSVEARDLTEAAEDLTRSAGPLDTLFRTFLLSVGDLRLTWSVESTEDRVEERTEDDPGVSFESGRKLGFNTLFLGVPFVVVLEVVEIVLRATERTELAEEATRSRLVGVS
jgi:hypothetical protein